MEAVAGTSVATDLRALPGVRLITGGLTGVVLEEDTPQGLGYYTPVAATNQPLLSETHNGVM